MSEDYSKIIMNIRSLAVFRALRNDPVICGLCDLLCALGSVHGKGDHDLSESTPIADLYSDFISMLYPVTSDLGEYIRKAVLADDNFYIEAIACGDDVGSEIHDAVKKELIGLQEVASLSSHEIRKALSQACSCSEDQFPSWTNSSVNLLSDFMDKLKELHTTGYGIYADHDFFRIEDGRIVPVPQPDVIPISHLFGYERQRNIIIKNTEALIDGSDTTVANNILLYGDAGTGKSSTVKAVAHEYARRGLRLIEIKKDQLQLIPMVLDSISRQPLRFILFIDDLSFSGNDDNFSALKATLEGSVTGRGHNSIIYATSNRRHLIRERFSDREGDELHVNDTLQETMSLSARFGLTVMFEDPERDEYLDIVENLARLSGIDIPREELFSKAEAHAIRRSGRNPRTAKQFVDLLKAQLI